MRRTAVVVLLAALSAAALASPAAAQGPAPAIRAVLFFSPTCGHCEYVINELLFPVWFPQFGGEPEVRWDETLAEPSFFLATNGTLEVLLADVSTRAGSELFVASNEPLGLPEDARGVPRLVVGDRYLIGSGEIPDEFPGIVEEGLAGGGIDWPNLPGIDEALAAVPPGEPAASTTTTAATTTPTATSSTTAVGSTTTAAPATTVTEATTTTGAAGRCPSAGIRCGNASGATRRPTRWP